MKRMGIIFRCASVLALACLMLLPALEASADDYGVWDFGIGYRTDDIDWNIAGTAAGGPPNVLSELTWDNLHILQIETGIRASVRRVYMRADFDYGWILSGDNQDSDYLGNNRTLEFSRSNNASDDGTVYDVSLGIGYTVIDKEFKLTPLAGYSYHRQELQITDGVQTITTPGITPPLGPFPGLDSTYDTKWHGPWIGVDMSHQFSDRFSLFGSFEYHWADYKGKANWNLRTDLAHPVSFSHDANGNGYVVAVKAEYTPKRFWPLDLEVKYQDWSTDAGTDRTFAANGASLATRLNEVNWQSFAVMLKTSYYFH